MAKIELDEDRREVTVTNSDGQYRLVDIHSRNQCSGNCVYHNPSDHPYLDWDLDPDGLRINPENGETVMDPDVQSYLDSLSGPRIRCTLCNTVIQSRFRHHVQYCECGKTAIDGGSSYTRIIGVTWVSEEVEG